MWPVKKLHDSQICVGISVTKTNYGHLPQHIYYRNESYFFSGCDVHMINGINGTATKKLKCVKICFNMSHVVLGGILLMIVS